MPFVFFSNKVFKFSLHLFKFRKEVNLYVELYTMQGIEKITSGLSLQAAFTALVVAFMIHNLEEAITICRFPVENPFPFIKPASCSQFIVSVSIISAAGLIALVIALRTERQSVYNFISTGLAAVLLLNVFVPHFTVAIYTFHYTPGLVSAMFINLPLSLLVLTKNRPLYTIRKQFLRHIFIFLIIGYVFFALSMGLAKLVT